MSAFQSDMVVEWEGNIFGRLIMGGEGVIIGGRVMMDGSQVIHWNMVVCGIGTRNRKYSPIFIIFMCFRI